MRKDKGTFMQQMSRIFFVALMLVAAHVNAQKTNVVKVRAATSQGIAITATVQPTPIPIGKNFAVTTSLSNRSGKTIYIVKRRDLQITAVAKERVLEVLPPYPLPTDHGDFDFLFIKVRSGATHREVITIPGSLTTADGTWLINLGLNYVDNVSDLIPPPQEGSDPAPWRTRLYTRLYNISVGKLTVEIVNHN